MEFKHNHSPGISNGTPHRIFDIEICNDCDQWIANIDRQEDAKLFLSASAMLDYMIERAKQLYAWSKQGQLREGEKEELERIISILRAAGVEVV